MRFATLAMASALVLPLACKSTPPPPPPPPPPPTPVAPLTEGYYLLARDGTLCALKGWGNNPRYEEVVRDEKTRLGTFGIAPREMWVAEELNPQFMPAECIPPGDSRGMQFLEQHPNAKAGLQKWNVTALCQDCGCPTINYVCAAATAPLATMEQAGFAQVR